MSNFNNVILQMVINLASWCTQEDMLLEDELASDGIVTVAIIPNNRSDEEIDRLIRELKVRLVIICAFRGMTEEIHVKYRKVNRSTAEKIIRNGLNKDRT